jgi:hypothetical protein
MAPDLADDKKVQQSGRNVIVWCRLAWYMVGIQLSPQEKTWAVIATCRKLTIQHFHILKSLDYSYNK